MKTIILQYFLKNVIHFDDSNGSNDSKEKISMCKFECLNLYLKNREK